jgi:hypothetical protein
VPRLVPGHSTTVHFDVLNHGPARLFNLTAADDRGYLHPSGPHRYDTTTQQHNNSSTQQHTAETMHSIPNSCDYQWLGTGLVFTKWNSTTIMTQLKYFMWTRLLKYTAALSSFQLLLPSPNPPSLNLRTTLAISVPLFGFILEVSVWMCLFGCQYNTRLKR